MEKINFCLILIIVSIVGTFSSCKKENRWDCVKKSGDEISETRVLNPYSKIYIEDYFDIYIQFDSLNYIEVTAGENLISNVKTDVIDSTLTISNINKCNWVRSYKNKLKLTIHATSLEEISMYNSASNLTFSDTLNSNANFTVATKNCTGDLAILCNVNELLVDMTAGAFNLTIKGSANKALYHASGDGRFYANQLFSPQCWINFDSVGEMYVYSSGYLFCAIESRGNVYYTGKPKLINKSLTGSGKLIEF